MHNHAIVVLDATGSMSGQEERVVKSANEYVNSLPEQTHLTLFQFDSKRWITFFDGDAASWKEMERKDYTPGAMTPLYDSVGKAINHADSIASSGDRVMMMVDTDGYENASREHTQRSIRAMVEERKKAGWAFMFMSQGLDRASVENIAVQGASMGMSRQRATHSSRMGNYARAGVRTRDYFLRGEQPAEGETLDDNRDSEPVGTGRKAFRKSRTRPERSPRSP